MGVMGSASPEFMRHESSAIFEDTLGQSFVAVARDRVYKTGDVVLSSTHAAMLPAL